MIKVWTDLLDFEAWERLANCRSQKKDILSLAQARWAFIKGKKNYCKEDALVYVLELLESNNCDYDLSTDEYKEILLAIL